MPHRIRVAHVTLFGYEWVCAYRIRLARDSEPGPVIEFESLALASCPGADLLPLFDCLLTTDPTTAEPQDWLVAYFTRYLLVLENIHATEGTEKEGVAH